MKKIYKLALSVALVMGAWTSANAQSGAFFFDGKQLANCDTITMEAEPNNIYDEKGNVIATLDYRIETKQRLMFHNLSGKDLERASGKMFVDEANRAKIKGFQWCGLNGLCVNGDLTSGSITKQNVKMAAGKKDSQLADIIFEVGKYAEATAGITISTGVGLDRYTVYIRAVYSPVSGINEVSSSAKLTFANNQLSYNFSKVAGYSINVYSVSGALVKSQNLSQSGSLSLGDLQRGLYIAEVKANGKKIATRKCLVE